MSSKGRSVRLPDALWERIEEMVERLQDDPEAALHGKVNRSSQSGFFAFLGTARWEGPGRFAAVLSPG